MKPLKFVGSSLDDLREFPAEARRAAGFELDAVQRGLEPSDWKPMNEVGAGVREIRIHVLGEWRVLYVVRFAELSMCFMLSRRKRRRPDGKTLHWRVNGIARLESGYEKENHKIERECLCGPWF